MPPPKTSHEDYKQQKLYFESISYKSLKNPEIAASDIKIQINLVPCGQEPYVFDRLGDD